MWRNDIMDENKTPTQTLLEDLLLVVEKSRRGGRHPQGSQEETLLNALYSELFRLHRRCLHSKIGYKIAFVGLGNVGKSTLINAVLGAKIAPVANGPCTAGIVEFAYGENFSVTAFRNKRLLQETQHFENSKALETALSEMVAHRGERDETFDCIKVSLPVQILKSGLILVDTPGFRAGGGIGNRDDLLVSDFLKKDVAQICWVVMADTGIGRDELNFYNTHLKERCDDIVVSNAEEFDAESRSRWCQRYKPCLAPHVHIHFVEGKTATDAFANNNKMAWAKSGAKKICDRIKNLKDNEGRIENVLNCIEALGKSVLERAAIISEKEHLFCPLHMASFLHKYRNEPRLVSSWTPLENFARPHR
jgi:GTPase SAR1 family protein